jgi:hypothetical protein|tara:strand:- start:2731 stop:3363 length:633 start_codon:yes stop_codon:yes gene_type:complete
MGLIRIRNIAPTPEIVKYTLAASVTGELNINFDGSDILIDSVTKDVDGIVDYLYLSCGSNNILIGTNATDTALEFRLQRLSGSSDIPTISSTVPADISSTIEQVQIEGSSMSIPYSRIDRVERSIVGLSEQVRLYYDNGYIKFTLGTVDIVGIDTGIDSIATTVDMFTEITDLDTLEAELHTALIEANSGALADLFYNINKITAVNVPNP